MGGSKKEFYLRNLVILVQEGIESSVAGFYFLDPPRALGNSPPPIPPALTAFRRVQT